MIKELRITNLALVEELNVTFDSNLIVFTGETGAGKSIILQAIDLLSGKRASSNWVREGADQARVDAVFDIPDRAEILEAISAMGIEAEGELLVSRVLANNGKSRYYLNGGLSTAKIVDKVSEFLLSVASQHDHQLLLTPRHHLDFIDLAGDLWDERVAFSAFFKEWQYLREVYDDLRARESERAQRIDFLTFQANEIKEARIRKDEDAELESEKKKLKGSDELRQRGGRCFDLLSDSAADALAAARKELEQMSAIDEGLSGLAAAVAEQSFIIEESISGLRNYLDEIPDDLERLESVTARIDLLQKLKRKYGPDLEDVLAHAAKIENELSELENIDKSIKEAEDRYEKASVLLKEKACKLSGDRREAAAKISAAVKVELEHLCFDQAEFEVLFHGDDGGNISQLTRVGWDRPEFLFSANPGESCKPLAQIASGGELSRLTLAMKCILARKDMVETVIFDEIDAGIGGKAAEAVAGKIRQLAEHHQVLCITHLPQIASGAIEHFMVQKNVCNGRTKTTISELTGAERVEELARMLDGNSVSEKSRAFAAELIERNSMRVLVHDV